MKRGYFITLEGMDGAGKSTHLQWLADYLRARGIDFVLTREPGGTPLGESLRALLLQQDMTAETEAMLMFAARREHVAKVIEPALQRGQWVVSDRFADASFAYQGGGRGLSRQLLQQLEAIAVGQTQPDLTLLFDVSWEVSQQRLQAGRQQAGQAGLDRFELEARDFFERVRQAYHQRAQEAGGRIEVIDASGTIAAIQATLSALMDKRLC